MSLALQSEIAAEKLKTYKLPGIDQVTADFIQAAVEH
jgi:hypothetical protein